MKLVKQELWVWVAALLPVLGLLGLVAKAEVAIHAGMTFRIPIIGYDPRDLFHGRFLQYQYDFDWQGTSTCHESMPARTNAGTPEPLLSKQALQFDCCLCFSRTSSDGFNPQVRQVDCAEPKSDCDAWIRSVEMMPPRRYFVPEDRAQALEQALRRGHASIEFAVTPNGTPAIKELYLDNRPWREALAE